MSSLRLVSQSDMISYLWIVFSALRRVKRLKLFAARELRFQLQNEKKPLVKSSGTGPGLGWMSPLRVSNKDKTQRAEISIDILDNVSRWSSRICTVRFRLIKRNSRNLKRRSGNDAKI